MNDYDFSTLNDKEFENLTIDLISRDRGKRFERFKAGRDGGIDGRYYGEDEKEEIIQCKHYLKTGYNGLISSLKKKNNGKNEADKVKLLNPDKYIFVTSLPLSASNKKEIKEIFEPYIKLDNDIYGQEDLNDLLKVNHDIEENHYKLWISSTTVLQRIFNNAIKGRSEFKLEEIKEKIKYYVVTDNHNNAIKKLEESHTIIIAGEPGIGKTTLAEQIVLNYIEKEFEFCVISNSINEAEAIFEKDKKQIFYFDDFLGSNYLSALESHTDSHIMQFIARIKKDKTKRFILTSRTNIFNQSLLLSDKFRTKKLDSDEFIIKVDDLKEMDKAKILYNHIWHSNLSEEYIDELYKEERYTKIIKHKNFNPRIIEFITDIDRIKSVSAKNYWEDIQLNLDNPSEIWANTFDNQSDEYIRNIVALVVFNGNSILETELEKAYTALNKSTLAQTYSHNNKDFDSVIKQTAKYFLNRRILSNGEIEYSLFNPSIADFILNKYKVNNDKLFLFLYALNNLNSLQHFFSLKTFSFISQDTFQKIVKNFYENIDTNQAESSTEIDFIIKIISLRDINQSEKVISFCQKIIYENKSFTLIKEFISILIDIGLEKININNYDFIIKMIDTESNSLNEINKIIELIDYFSIQDKEVFFYLNDLINRYLGDELDSKVESLNISEICFYENEDEIDIDDDEIENKVDAYFDDLVNEIISFKYIDINKNDITSNIYIDNVKDRLIDEYISDYANDHYDHRDINSNYSNDEIDDLFQRS